MTLRPGHDSIMYDKSGKLRKAIHDVYLLDALAWLCSSNWPIGYAHQVRAHRISAFFKCLLRTFTHSGPGKTKFVRKLPLFEEVRWKEVF